MKTIEGPLIGKEALVGKWIEADGYVVPDPACEQIQRLTESHLKLIVVNADNWSALYLDPDDSSYWELTYPQSHMHGGGPPALHRIAKW